jgi:hypothetical protein
MAGYRYPAKTKRRPGTSKLPKGYRDEWKEPEEQLTLIQGKVPGSKEEWRVAMALYQMGVEFTYQKPLFGGYWPGGMVIDFWVYKSVRPTPLLVHGDAWHNAQNSATDDWKKSKMKQQYRGFILEPVIIWGSEVPTIDEAKRILKERL